MKTLLTILALASLTLLEATAAPVAPQIKVDWPEFIGRHDLVWEQLPRQWENHPLGIAKCPNNSSLN